MKHIDLFSGIGGFALAVDTVWPGSEHIFVDNDKFCQQVLKKHWPNSQIHGDIRQFITDTEHNGLDGTKNSEGGGEGTERNSQGSDELRQPQRSDTLWATVDILTGGFPCQPFSQAGRRKGTADDRYLWPEMFRVIQLTNPTWVIAENVRGLVTWNDGLVLEQVCVDLEGEGYEVQPFIIPAVAINAPHRRDRIWIVANRKSRGEWSGQPSGDRQRKSKAQTGNDSSDAQNSISQRSGGRDENSGQVSERQSSEVQDQRPSWESNWIEVATELCRVDDGLPAKLDGFELTKSAHRRERLKSLGNAIVPQVAIQIMRSLDKLM